MSAALEDEQDPLPAAAGRGLSNTAEFETIQAAGLSALAGIAVEQPAAVTEQISAVRPSAPPVGGRHRKDRAVGHRRRFAIFAAIGVVTFAAGAALQWALVRRAGADTSYIWQAIFSIELSYILNRWLTWRDRDVPVLVSLARWNAQKAILYVPNLLVYDALIHAGAGWLTANVVVSVAFAAINYVTGDLWSFATRLGFRRAADAQRSDTSWATGSTTWWLQRCAAAIVTVLLTAGALGALVHFAAARWIIYTAWMMPVIELAMIAAGHVAYRRWFRVAPEGKFRHLIIQITTTGAEQARVNEIIDQIRDYRLKMEYEIWVVTEPGRDHDYPFADRVAVVPATFTARSSNKARALEFSRQLRETLGLSRADVKIIFNDDDVSLTQAYIERAFEADYDVCEGVVTPRTAYATRPFGHFLASHADDIRTHACLAYCSVFQGIIRRPVHVHGEGLVTTGRAEWLVTWDWPVFASEDLVFGQRAAAARLSWGWFHEYAEVTSPWSIRDYLIQRRRWLWGDIHAVTHNVMPVSSRAMVAGKYLIGVTVLLASVAGLYLRVAGGIPATAGALDWAKLSILAWIGVFFACGWVGAASPGRVSDSRLLAGVLAVAMVPVSLLLTFAAIAVPLVEGNPRSFSVISKTRRDA